jgi:MerR family transcriptional regulator/heat shock protein HspR
MQRHNRRTVNPIRTIVEGFVIERGPTPSRPAPAAGEAPQGGLYIISVAARILSMHPQTLRKYERVGLVRPSRTVGMLRLYSEQDITKLRIIKRLVDELRLNLAGVEMAMLVFDRLATAHREMGAEPPSVSSEAFERMFEQIMDFLLGPRDPGDQSASGQPQ